MLGCPLSTVKTRLYQGLTVLRKQLRDAESRTCSGRRRAAAAGGQWLGARRAADPMTAWCDLEDAMCDKELLVGYLYDDMAPANAGSWTLTCVTCEECRTELNGLRGTRTTLSDVGAAGPRSSAFHFVRPAAAPVPRRRARGLSSPAWGAGRRGASSCSRWPPRSRTSKSGTAPRASASAPGRRGPSRPRRAGSPDPDGQRARRSRSRARSSPTSASGCAPSRRRTHACRCWPRCTRRRAAPSDLRDVRQMIADSESRQEQVLARRITQVLRDVEGGPPDRFRSDRSAPWPKSRASSTPR